MNKWSKISTFLFVPLFLVVFLHLLNSYWAFFDYGLNASANLFGLVFSGIIALVVFSVSVALGNFIASRFKMSDAFRIFTGLLLLKLSFWILFFYEMQRLRDYPTPNKSSFIEFIQHYLRNLIG